MSSKLKIPKAKQLPSGNWICQIYRGGKRKAFVSSTEDGAIKEAMLWSLQLDNSVEAKSYVKNSLTLSEAIDHYVQRKGSILSPSTIRGYDQIKRLRFQSVIDMPIGTEHDWQALVNEEIDKGLSSKTVSNAWGLIRAVLKHNKIPYEEPDVGQIIRKDKVFLQPEQLKPFMEAIHGDRFEMAYLLCLHSLRRSEMLAVKKSMVYDGEIHVEGSMVVNKEGKLVYKETNKNSASRRNIPVFIPRLQELIDQYPEQKKKKKGSEDDPFLVPHAPGNMFSHLQVICRNNDLPELGFHSLRHSFCSLCYHLGISEMGCQALGGWDDPNTMRKIYAHLAEVDKKNAEVKLKGFFTTNVTKAK